MKDHLATFARDVDAFCARLNDGLIAVAVLLALLVIVMMAIRAQEYFAQTLTSLPASYQMPLEYY